MSDEQIDYEDLTQMRLDDEAGAAAADRARGASAPQGGQGRRAGAERDGRRGAADPKPAGPKSGTLGELLLAAQKAGQGKGR